MITRPREQAGRLEERIGAAGGRALIYPAIEIDDVADPGPLERIAGRLEQFDLAIFVSPTAARTGLAFVRGRRAWPERLAAAAVGRGTRAELERLGIAGAVAPQTGADSEALLAHPLLSAVRGKRIVIFRGEGGRELLGKTLESRGAHVEYAECYRRSPPREDVTPLLQAWARGEVHAVTSSSSAGLQNLFAALGSAGSESLRRTPIFVSHARIAEAARRLGAEQVIVAGPGDPEMADALVAYFRPA